MDKQKFIKACEKIIDIERAKNGIGTLGEKTLHAVLKLYFEPNTDNHEVKVGSFVADIATDYNIIEIQTRSFDKLRKKLSVFLETQPVTIVYPVPKTKWLLWIDQQTGETTKRRKSTKQGRVFDIISELYKIKPLINHANFRICMVFIDMEEYRYLDGWSKDKKKGSTRCDRIPTDIVDEVCFGCTADYAKLLPNGLPAQFTSKDYKAAAQIQLHIAQTALNILRHVGVIELVGKKGSLFLYEKAKTL
jgi:hypothetical protein